MTEEISWRIEMPSNFDYMVFSGIGDLAIFNPEAEARCPYPKTMLIRESEFNDAIDDTWSQFGLDRADSASANAFNIENILIGTLPSVDICSYHLGRGTAAAVLEDVAKVGRRALSAAEPSAQGAGHVVVGVFPAAAADQCRTGGAGRAADPTA